MVYPANEAMQTQVLSAVLAGGIIGSLGGASRHSALGNLIGSVAGSAVLNGIEAALGNQKFFSRESLYSALILTASSSVMHLIIKSKADSHDKSAYAFAPKIEFAPDCKCNVKSWVEKSSAKSADAAMAR